MGVVKFSLFLKGGKMKKLLVAVLACAMVAPAFAAFDNVQITGDVQTIGLAIEGQGTNAILPDTVSERGTTSRVLFGVGADLVEDVTAKITFAHEKMFGDYNLTGNTITGGTGVLDNTRVAEAFVNVANVFDALEVKVGRQFYGDEKSAVMYLGPINGYAIDNYYRSVDGTTVRYNGDNLTLTAAYLTLTNTGSSWLSTDHLNIAGLDGIVKVNDNLALQAYIYDVRQRNTVTPIGSFWGVKPTFELDFLKASVEFARNYGDIEKAWLLKADLALPLELSDNITVTPRAAYTRILHGFTALGNYRPGLMFGTLYGDVTSFAAITDKLDVWNVGACLKVASIEKWGFGLDFYKAKAENAGVTDQANSWEANVIYNHNEYVSFRLTGAILTGVNQTLKESPFAGQLGMNVKF